MHGLTAFKHAREASQPIHSARAPHSRRPARSWRAGRGNLRPSTPPAAAAARGAAAATPACCSSRLRTAARQRLQHHWPVTRARGEQWAHLSKVGGKVVGGTKPRGLGRGVRAGWLQQRLAAAAANRRPIRQLQKKIMAVLEVCAAQGTGWLRRKMNLVRGKRVPGAPWRRRKCEGSAARLAGVALGSEFVTRGEFSRGSMTLLEKDRIAFCTFLLDSGI